MPDWEPPIIRSDYDRKARVATQADVDRLLLVERRYNELMRIFREEITPLIEMDDGNG